MCIRPLVPSGLALVVFVGCQSYFPSGYGNGGAYPNMSQPYVPQGSPGAAATAPNSTLQSGAAQFPTPANGQKNLPAGQTGGSSSSGTGQVPKYGDPATPPSNLGSPDADDDDDSINRGSGKRESSSRRTVEADDDSEVAFSMGDEEKFMSPTKYRAASADDGDTGRVASRPRPSPYLKDPNGYKWLRGVVSRDARTNSWRITYSRDPLDDDPYGGSLTLVDSPLLDTLLDDDTVIIEGAVDRSALDRYKKPSYRATSIRRITPKMN
jgi:hypothetical protein